MGASHTALPVPRAADATHEYVHAQGWLCGCGHRHAGVELGGRCPARCGCARVAPTVAEFDRMRGVRFADERAAEEMGPW